VRSVWPLEWGEGAVGAVGIMSNVYEASIKLAQLELERQKLLARKVFPTSDLEEQYRSARIQELTDLLLAEEDWLASLGWRCVNGSTGRELKLGERNDGCGVVLCYEDQNHWASRRPSICIDFPYEQKEYRVFIDTKEDEVRTFFFPQEAACRVAELIFECDQLAKEIE
jgi:hypothetical protein